MTGPKSKLRPILVPQEDRNILQMKNVDVHLLFREDPLFHEDVIYIESLNGGCNEAVFAEEVPALIKALRDWLRDHKARTKMERSE